MIPIYQIISTDPASRALLYDPVEDRVRVWDFGYALEYEVHAGPNVKPYVVWQMLPSTFNNTLSCPPNYETVSLQFDVYARDPIDTMQVQEVIQYPLMPYGQLTTSRGQGFEPDVKLYRSGFDFTFLRMRA